MQTQGSCWEIGRGGHSWDVRRCCFLGSAWPCGSNPQGSRASICVAHGRHGLYFSPENPQSTKVQMDVEGLGTNSSLRAALSLGFRAQVLTAFPPQLTSLTETAVQVEKNTPNAEKDGRLHCWCGCCFHNPTSLT